eukprot:gnl/TRDRNA2_/TRDRNA2_204886_c0_seq1.p1 gnl/TRDRNA2_/TRDRNA2_204886_c0~~gnl/TRDRNA2_/TRDRNA2_204886_c0_seq1.p1  ORF type:complete len:100 (-),score=1.38 gnl/TRDRNA2_/TRDRNA2_204886_c0_seq1:80-379(-)
MCAMTCKILYCSLGVLPFSDHCTKHPLYWTPYRRWSTAVVACRKSCIDEQLRLGPHFDENAQLSAATTPTLMSNRGTNCFVVFIRLGGASCQMCSRVDT